MLDARAGRARPPGGREAPAVGTERRGAFPRLSPGRCARTGSAGRPSWSPTGRRPGSPTRRRRSARCPRAGAATRGLPRLCRCPGAARRSGPAAGHGARRARGEGGRARPGRGAGAARCPGRDRRARAGTGRTRRTAPQRPGTPWTPRRPRRPKPRPRTPPQDLARLAVADAARREWAEAHAGQAEAAREAEGELRRRDQADRVARAGEPAQEQQVETDAEFRARLDRRWWPRPRAASGYRRSRGPSRARAAAGASVGGGVPGEP